MGRLVECLSFFCVFDVKFFPQFFFSHVPLNRFELQTLNRFLAIRTNAADLYSLVPSFKWTLFSV